MPEKKTASWLLAVNGQVNISRDPKANVFWQGDGQKNGYRYSAYVGCDKKLGERYAKNADMSLKFFGPIGGPHQNLQGMQRLTVTGARLNLKIQKMAPADRTAVLAAIDALSISADAKNIAKGAIWSGRVEHEIVLSDDQWSFYDNTNGAEAPVNTGTSPPATNTKAPVEEPAPSDNKAAPPAKDPEPPKEQPTSRPTNPFKPKG